MRLDKLDVTGRLVDAHGDVSPAAAALLVSLAAVVASVAGLDNGFAFDDVVIVADNARVHELRWPWAYLRESYWGPARGDDLYRPLTIFGFALQWALGNGSALPFHLTNVALYAICAVAVYFVARQLFAPMAALFAALVFAVHPVHVEAVANVVGQAELLVALASLASVHLYILDRRDGRLQVRTMGWLTLLYLAALLVKEHAIVIPLLLLAAEFTLSPRQRETLGFPGGRRVESGPRSLKPRTAEDQLAISRLFLMFALTVVAYLAVRILVIGRLTGDVPHPGIAQAGLIGRVWVMIGLAPDLARVLLWPASLSADYSPQLVSLHPTASLAHLPGALILLGFGVLLLTLARRSRSAAFCVLWLVATFALPSNIPVPTGVLMAERTLFLPSVGIAMLLGVALSLIWRSQSRWRPLGRTLIGALLVLGASRSSARQPAWEDNAAVISTMIAEHPRLFRGHLMLGETLALHNEFERAAPALRRAVELYPDFATSQLDYARVLQLLDRCGDALPFFEAALQLDPGSQVGQLNRVICLLKVGRLHEGRLRALEGLASGSSPSAFRVMRWTADSMLVAADSVDSRNLFARSGRDFEPLGTGEFNLRIRYELPRPELSTSGNMQESSPSDSERTPK